MKQLIREYRFIKIAQQICKDVDNSSDMSIARQGYIGAHAITASVKRDFHYKYPKILIPDINYICVDAIHAGYLEGCTDMLNSAPIDTLCITPRGRKLLDKPLGTAQEFLGAYGLVISFLTGVFFITIIFLVAKWLWSLARMLFGW